MADIIQNATKQLAKKQKTMKDYVESMSGEIAKALPSVITPERFTRITLSALSTNPQLQQTTPQSFLGAMMTAAQLGLEPNTPLGQAYLLPYKNKGVLETQIQIGYKGLMDLAYRSGEISVIQAHTVYENDEFHYEFGLEPKLEHKPAIKDRGDAVAYYAMFKTKDGGYGFEVMSVQDVKLHAKKYSKSYDSAYSPWTTNFDEMAKKGLALDTKIPTPDGWKTMGELEIGDTVFDMYGKKTKVIAVSEVKHIDCFKITFSNGDSVICDNEHRWVAEISSNASRRVKENGWRTLTVNELYEEKKNGGSVKIPMNPALDLPERDDLLIDPWVLGYWLGNGSKQHARVTCDVKDKEYVKSRISEHYEVSDLVSKPESNAAEIGIKSNFITKLREEGVLNNKHIPMKYKRGSFSQRLALLQGLMDSDGHIDKERGRASFSNCNKALADDVAELAASLGECVSRSVSLAKGFGKEVVCHNVTWKPANQPVGMPRKLERVTDRKLEQYRSVKSVEKIDSVPTKCIAVDSETRTYLCGESMIPTHNTVLKRVLKYAPLKSDFARQVTADESIKTDISSDMLDVANEPIEAEGSIVVDNETGEIKDQK